MNERIKELAGQSGFGFGSYEFENEYDMVCGSVSDLKKFAELIVRECGNVAWQHTPETEDLEYSHLIKDKILEHFGVE